MFENVPFGAVDENVPFGAVDENVPFGTYVDLVSKSAFNMKQWWFPV